MADVLKKQPETEMEYWEAIECLGGVIWHTNHDISHGRYDMTEEIGKMLIDYQKTVERLANEVVEKFNVIHPKDCPRLAFGEARPSAPEGKTYYWDWYERMKAEFERQYLEGLICSACPFKKGDELIGNGIPCGIFPGSLYQLRAPHECGLVSYGDYDEESLAAKIVEDHGEEALDKFNKKKQQLMAAAHAAAAK